MLDEKQHWLRQLDASSLGLVLYRVCVYVPQNLTNTVYCQVETTDGESDRLRLFKVSIKWVQTISIASLLAFVRLALDCISAFLIVCCSGLLLLGFLLQLLLACLLDLGSHSPLTNMSDRNAMMKTLEMERAGSLSYSLIERMAALQGSEWRRDSTGRCAGPGHCPEAIRQLP